MNIFRFTEDWIVGLIWLSLGLLLIVAIAAALYEGKQWRQFAQEHNCRVIGDITASIGTGVSANGQVVTSYIPGKTGYQCDDGQIYWR